MSEGQKRPNGPGSDPTEPLPKKASTDAQSEEEHNTAPVGGVIEEPHQSTSSTVTDTNGNEVTKNATGARIRYADPSATTYLSVGARRRAHGPADSRRSTRIVRKSLNGSISVIVLMLVAPHSSSAHHSNKNIVPIVISSAMEPLPERGQWSGQLDFILSCTSYAIGLGNVW